MTMRDLIPWGRQGGSNAPARLQDERSDPIVGLHRSMNRLFDDFLRDPFASAGVGRSLSGGWPSLEVNETEHELRITAEVPGMKEKDVELFVEDGMLTLRGERRNEAEDKDRGYSERYYGRFERRIALPSNVDEEAAKANFSDGVLTITLPKNAEAARGRRIPINGQTKH